MGDRLFRLTMTQGLKYGRKKKPEGKQEEARHSLRCHKSGGNRLEKLTASKLSSSETILSNPHNLPEVISFTATEEKHRALQNMALNSQRNKYLPHSPQAGQAGHPSERRSYFKVPKWLASLEAMRDAFPLAFLDKLIHFLAQEISACASPQHLRLLLRTEVGEDRGSLVDEELGAQLIFQLCYLDLSEPQSFQLSNEIKKNTNLTGQL